MDTTPLQCLLADPSFAACYDHASLNAADSQRLAATPQLAQRQDWQVSRALKQQTDLPTVSLSHSQGFAALLCAPHPLTAGVDIEFIRPRDFKALSSLVCTQEEQDFLETANWPSETFYRLWCFKEALIKAANLDFPSDMKSVGYVSIQATRRFTRRKANRLARHKRDFGGYDGTCLRLEGKAVALQLAVFRLAQA